jgi:hypothetical protein
LFYFDQAPSSAGFYRIHPHDPNLSSIKACAAWTGIDNRLGNHRNGSAVGLCAYDASNRRFAGAGRVSSGFGNHAAGFYRAG